MMLSTIRFLFTQIEHLGEPERQRLWVALQIFYPEVVEVRAETAERVAFASEELLAVWEDLQRLIRSRFEREGLLQPLYASGEALADYGVLDARYLATYDEIRLVIDELRAQKREVTYDPEALANYVREVRNILATEHAASTLPSTAFAPECATTSA